MYEYVHVVKLMYPNIFYTNVTLPWRNNNKSKQQNMFMPPLTLHHEQVLHLCDTPHVLPLQVLCFKTNSHFLTLQLEEQTLDDSRCLQVFNTLYDISNLLRGRVFHEHPVLICKLS